MEPILKVVLWGLAAWRIAALISYERGPFDLFLKFREVLGFEHGVDGRPTVWPRGFIPQLVSCVWCLSIWGVLAVWGLWVVEPVVVYLLAAMTVVVAVERWTDG